MNLLQILRNNVAVADLVEDYYHVQRVQLEFSTTMQDRGYRLHIGKEANNSTYYFAPRKYKIAKDK